MRRHFLLQFSLQGSVDHPLPHLHDLHDSLLQRMGGGGNLIDAVKSSAIYMTSVEGTFHLTDYLFTDLLN